MARTLLLLLLLAACRPAAPAATCAGTIADAAFLTGAWQRSDDGVRSDELWGEPAGASMLGHGRRSTATRTEFFEFLRIEARPAGLVYVAQPGGGPPVEFPLAACGPDDLRFANPAHDFPQQLHYRRDGDALHITIAGPGPNAVWIEEPSALHRAAR